MKTIQVLVVALAALGLAALGSAQTSPQAPAPARPAFVDNDGDGICDNCTGTGQRVGRGNGSGKRRGPGDGTGYQGQGPRDGSARRPFLVHGGAPPHARRPSRLSRNACPG
jgi:hypothetical protein